MEYLIMLYTEENVDRPEPGSPEFEAYMTDWFRFNQQLIDGGHWIAGGSLQPTVTATTLRKPFGGPIAVTDGPYLETKEQFGGFYLIRADDLDQALALAEQVPLPAGSFEVRPMAFRPDAPKD